MSVFVSGEETRVVYKQKVFFEERSTCDEMPNQSHRKSTLGSTLENGLH